MYYLGIDVGSCSCNAVIIDQNTFICAYVAISTGSKNIKSIETLTNKIIE